MLTWNRFRMVAMTARDALGSSCKLTIESLLRKPITRWTGTYRQTDRQTDIRTYLDLY